MRRSFQFAAAAVILLLLAQPALGSLSCATAPCPRGCAMCGAAMGSDCMMDMGGAAAQCAQPYCTQMRGMATLPAQETIRAMAGSSCAGLLHSDCLAQAETVTAGSSQASVLFASPPLHILHQVFRI